jgi:copper chaperone
MTLTINVPSIKCSGCANTVTRSIADIDPTATVKVDLETKLVTVDTQASETTVKEAIASAGHTVA